MTSKFDAELLESIRQKLQADARSFARGILAARIAVSTVLALVLVLALKSG
jgi:hypothetical protein